MDAKKLERFLDTAKDLASSLDNFVNQQRLVSKAVRSKDWIALEEALKRAEAASELVAAGETERLEAWRALLAEFMLPEDSSVYRVSLALPIDARNSLTDGYRELRLAGMRARIENEALGSFVGADRKSVV